MHKNSIKIIISGLVQGVGFRYHTREKAVSLGLVGYVKNRDNQQVEIVAEGDEEKINALIVWIKSGDHHAKAENIEIIWQKPSKIQSFEILYYLELRNVNNK